MWRYHLKQNCALSLPLANSQWFLIFFFFLVFLLCTNKRHLLPSFQQTEEIQTPKQSSVFPPLHSVNLVNNINPHWTILQSTTTSWLHRQGCIRNLNEFLLFSFSWSLHRAEEACLMSPKQWEKNQFKIFLTILLVLLSVLLKERVLLICSPSTIKGSHQRWYTLPWLSWQCFMIRRLKYLQSIVHLKI